MTASWIVVWSVLGVIGAVLLWLFVVALLVIFVEDRSHHDGHEAGPPEAENIPAEEPAERHGALVS
jgi:hypothetical protein